jgi:hypothetical protein
MDGIIVAADQTLEWMLPWWFENYRKHNAYPVAFIDLGLSFESKEWCQKHGQWIPLRNALFAEDVCPERAEKWEEFFGTYLWESRDAWFKKPLACLKSPFKRTLWLDVDCEVRAPLTPLFAYADRFAMARQADDFSEGFQIYNSGVIAFRQNHPLLSDWADLCLTGNHYFPGDQDAISYLIANQQIEVEELPEIYNWSRRKEEVPGIVVLHWHGHHGKAIIRAQLAQREMLRALSETPQESPPHTENRGASQAQESR